MRTIIAIAVVVTFSVGLAYGQVGAEASRVLCEPVAKATDGQGRPIKKSTFTVSLFTNELTCIVKTPPKSYCNFTTALAIDPSPTNVVPGVPTVTNQFTCYAMKCPKNGGISLGTSDDFTPNGLLLDTKSPSLYCTPIARD